MRKVDLLRIAITSRAQYPGIFLDKTDGIASYGNAWINSGLSNTGDYIFEDEFLLYSLEPNRYDGNWLFGSRKSSAYTLGVFIGKIGVYNGYGGSTAAAIPVPTVNEWHSMYFSRKKLTIDDISYAINGGILVPAEYESTLLIGRIDLNWAGTGEDFRMLYGRRRSLIITDATNMRVLRHYRAFHHEDGRLGFWEMINNEFLESLGDPFVL